MVLAWSSCDRGTPWQYWPRIEFYLCFDGWDSARQMGKPTSVYELQHSIADHYLANYQIYLAELHLTLEGVQ